MSTEFDHAREVAARIARRVAGPDSQSWGQTRSTAGKPELSSELAAVRAGLNDLQKKIAQLEAKVGSSAATSDINLAPASAPSAYQTVPLTHSPWLAGVNASIAHPSQEKFGVEEAVVSQLVDYFEKEKTCSVEPGNKPCDHCAMCSSRGF